MGKSSKPQTFKIVAFIWSVVMVVCKGLGLYPLLRLTEPCSEKAGGRFGGSSSANPPSPIPLRQSPSAKAMEDREIGFEGTKYWL
jgi:hypothetical protein